MSGYEAAGRRFRTESEYKAAKRDLKLIEEIKSKVHMEQPGEVISLCEALAEGKYRFESVIGNEFDDEVYELAEQYKSQGYTKSSRLPEGKRARKKAQKKQNKASGAKASSGKDKKKKAKPQASLEDYDADMRKAILEEMKRREKRRKLLVILCGITAIGCFSYFGVYSYFSDRTQMDYEELASLKGNYALAGAAAAPGQAQNMTLQDISYGARNGISGPIPQSGTGASIPQSGNFGETTVLSVASGETTVLRISPQGGSRQAYLVRRKTGEQILLNKPMFRVGKERSFVDYFIGDNTAVSRSHANFIFRDGAFFVEDTNSTNHTFINGAMIPSNTESGLAHGDKVTLADEEFEFRMM